MQPRRHRMRKHARRESRTGVDPVRRDTVKTYAKWYGVDRYTAYEDLVAVGFPLPAAAEQWAQRPPATPPPARRHTDDLDDRFGDPDWVWVGDRRMFVVGYTAGGVPFGCYEDEFDDLP